MPVRYDRVFFFGDSITLGCNDNLDLGWPGRLCKGMETTERGIAVYNLGINGDTSTNVAARWYDEYIVRSRESKGLIVFAFGFNDASRKDGAGPQVDLNISVETAKSILIQARELSEVLWIGPTPLDETVNPMQSNEGSWVMLNDDIAAYDRAYANLADEAEINYLPLHKLYQSSQRYQSALKQGDKVHPADDGYAMIAESVANWKAWKNIFTN